MNQAENSDVEDSFYAVHKNQRKTKPRAVLESEESEDSSSDTDSSSESLKELDGVTKGASHEDEDSNSDSDNQSLSEGFKPHDDELSKASEDSSNKEDVLIEDSFAEENAAAIIDSFKENITEQKKLDSQKSPFTQMRPSIMTEYSDDDELFPINSIVDTTDDEEDVFEPQRISGADIDLTDDEDVKGLKNKKMRDSSTVQTLAEVHNTNDFMSSTQLNESSDLEAIEKSFSIVEVSSDEETRAPLKQTNIKTFFQNPTVLIKPKEEPRPKSTVSVLEYQEQMKKVTSVEADLLRAKNAMRIVNLANLPDKGKSLLDKEKALSVMWEEQKKVLANMVVEMKAPVTARNKVEVAWDQIEAGVNDVAPRTLGKKGVAQFNVEKQMAVETLDHLHKSLQTCPTENDSVDDPKGLKVPLMPHQRRALAWLLWREKEKPSGGLLADDMGLGKTLTMISLVLKTYEIGEDESDKENYRDKYAGGTLVVCPASLMNQWSGEVERRTKRGLLSVELYHGAKRESKARRLAKHDMVITTYSLILNENEKNGAIFGVRWRRIILDEAHQIRNHKSKTAEACFRLSGKSRWALTGTPVHNKELDMYAILKFLRCTPFDDLKVWKHWVGDKSSGGEMRLHAVISSLMLRRTKAELMAKGTLQSLPDRNWELISVTLEKNEMDVYQKVLIFSRTLFAQFLHQRAEKNQDAYDMKFNGAPPDPNNEYFKMRNKLLKLNRVKEVSQHEILVLLLRLRQICCHPCLIKQMLQGDEDLGNAEDEEESEELNLLEQLNKLTLNAEDDHPSAGLNEEGVGLKEASKGFLNPSNPIFLSDRPSSKIRALIKLLKEKVPKEDKVIIVSQWTSLLNIISIHMKDQGIVFDSLNGTIPVPKRMPIVDNFNDPNSTTRVLLLSLTAGGVGLNLVGANHLFLLDLHWNPQLESQAQDRIYRMGQNKPIYVYKFMAVETIEERIKALQDKKLEIAESMLTGSKRVGNSKLSVEDLKMLFGFK